MVAKKETVPTEAFEKENKILEEEKTEKEKKDSSSSREPERNGQHKKVGTV